MNPRSIPNLVTGIRLVLLPVLWGFALTGRSEVVGAGLFLAWLTDALDGFLARRLRAETPGGSRLDSVADGLIFVSALAWVLMLRPDFLRAHATVISIWIAIGVASYLVGWIRFRRLADVHLYSAKAANFLGFLFVAHLLSFGAYPPVLFYFVIGVCIVAAIETLLVLSTRDRVDEHVVTILQEHPRVPPSSSTR